MNRTTVIMLLATIVFCWLASCNQDIKENGEAEQADTESATQQLTVDEKFPYRIAEIDKTHLRGRLLGISVDIKQSNSSNMGRVYLYFHCYVDFTLEDYREFVEAKLGQSVPDLDRMVMSEDKYLAEALLDRSTDEARSFAEQVVVKGDGSTPVNLQTSAVTWDCKDSDELSALTKKFSVADYPLGNPGDILGPLADGSYTALFQDAPSEQDIFVVIVASIKPENYPLNKLTILLPRENGKQDVFTYENASLANETYMQEEEYRAGSTLTSKERNAIRTFVFDFVVAQNKNDIDNVLSFYADKVDYYSWGTVDKIRIKGDKQAYFKRWPVREYAIQSGDIIINTTDMAGVYYVSYGVDYSVKHPEDNRSSSGLADANITVCTKDETGHLGSGFEIIREISE